MAIMTEKPPAPVSLLDEPPAKPYHAKRPHQKSRSGCKNCKARKVKCDETKPACRNCRQRKVDCNYPISLATTKASLSLSPRNHAGESTTLSIHITALSSSSPSPSALVSSAPVPSSARGPDQAVGIMAEPLYHPAGIDEIDMKLLWFYTTKTCASFSVEGEEEALATMRNVLVRYAFESPFLMSSVFALSSLHLQILNQQVDSGRALAYCVKSFEGYRQAVHEAKPESFPALVANSLLLTALSSQNFRDPNAEDLYILDWLVVWKGIALMIDLITKPTLVKTGLSCLFFRPPMDLDKAASFIPNHLLFMISSVQPDDPDYPHKQTYYDTLKYLGGLCMYLQERVCPILTLRVATIFTFAPNPFVELARNRRPRALIMLAHFAVFFKVIQSEVWWTRDIGQRTIKDIYNHLDLKWHHLLRIPLLALGIDEPIGLARLIIDDPSWVPKMPSGQLFQPVRLWVDHTGKEIGLNDKGEISFRDSTHTERSSQKLMC